MNIYATISFGGLLGIILHALQACIKINKRNANVNLKMVFTEYFQTEGFSFLVSVFCYGVILFVSSEFINYKAVSGEDQVQTDLKDKLLHFQVSNFIKVTSVVVGFFADSIVYGFLGKTEKSLKAKFGTDGT